MVHEYLNNKTFEILISGFQHIKKEKNQLEFLISEIDTTCCSNSNFKSFKIPDSWNKIKEKQKQSTQIFKDTQEKLAFAFYTLSENIVKYAKFNLIDQDDAIQEGVMICFEKVDRFDPSKGKAFNYMTTCILNHFKQLYRSARNYNELKRKYLDYAQIKFEQNLPYASKSFKKNNINHKT